jgi:hypothetical protein
MKKIFIIFSLFGLIGCDPTEEGEFMHQVINLEEFNSEFDDYNSDIKPSLNKSGRFTFVFSSKRVLKEYYNLVAFDVKLGYDGKRDILSLDKVTRSNNGGALYSMPFEFSFVSMANGAFNVLGPGFVEHEGNHWGNESPQALLTYADDKSGNLDLKAIYTDSGRVTKGPVDLSYLNSSSDDAYAFFYNETKSVVFCSNREGKFSIYEAELLFQEELSKKFERLVKPASASIAKVNAISSVEYDDKCPYVLNDNLMVFVSNRPGGYGGFDIYYSKKIDGVWQEPINAGPRINTKFDEYRPILPKLQSFTYPLMIFSSNRPGGKGGFDLYMTGLEVD